MLNYAKYSNALEWLGANGFYYSANTNGLAGPYSEAYLKHPEQFHSRWVDFMVLSQDILQGSISVIEK